jgi:hypothetical protein
MSVGPPADPDPDTDTDPESPIPIPPLFQFSSLMTCAGSVLAARRAGM